MPFTRSQRIALLVIPRIASAVIRLLGATLRYHNVCAPGVIPGDQLPSPGVYGFWHQSLLMAAYRFRNRNIAILISQSFDGELIARTVERLGFVAIRGSSSRGGATGLLAMERAIRAGHKAAFTADGPRGPAHVAKAGLTLLAQRTTGDVGAFHLCPASAWRLRSWDNFLIPIPFTRVAVSWPQHTRFTQHETLDAAHTRTQQMMEHATAMAELSATQRRRT